MMDHLHNSLTISRCGSVLIWTLDIRKLVWSLREETYIPTAETKADHGCLSDSVLYVCLQWFHLLRKKGGKKDKRSVVRVESFGKVWAHICSQIQNCQAEIPLIRSGRLSSLDWGCLFFSLPVTPSPHRSTEVYTHTLHVHIRGRPAPQRHGSALI